MSDIVDLRSLKGPHVFVTNLDEPALNTDDRNHLSKSLRLRDGDPLTICDANRRWAQAEFGDQITRISDIYTVDTASRPRGILVALAKGSKTELVTQKATELDIDHIIFFQARHSVSRWDSNKATKSIDRLRRISREASMQSKRLTLPEVVYEPTFEAALSKVASLTPAGAPETAAPVTAAPVAASATGMPETLAPMTAAGANVRAVHTDAHRVVQVAGPVIVRADFGSTELAREVDWIAIGPEGGWHESERDLLPDVIDLGPTVLRCETAAIAAAVLLAQHRRK